ncbi:MAG: hypothetical protein CMJ13_04600 [Pelagibacterales bacterium]|nr:hypothetical protein [Pelagibacterales bacterium]
MNNNKTILISGASKGVGLEVARLFNKYKYNLILVSRNFEKKYLQKFDSPEKVFLLPNGIESSDLIKNINDLLKTNSILSPSIIINNSGGPNPKLPSQITVEELENYFNSGMVGFMNVIQKYTPFMTKNNWGRIINIGSTVSKEPSAIMSISATIRAGLIAYSKALSLELADKGVTVNTINLGGVLTGRIKNLFSKIAETEGVSVNDKIKQAEKSIPMQRFAKPEEVAYLVEFLCSEKANYITGQTISIDGGLSKSI